MGLRQTLYDWCMENGKQEILSEWHQTRNGSLTPADVFPRSMKKVWWYLPYDDPKTGKHFDFEWEAPIQTMTKSTKKCPYLANNKVWKGFNDLASMFPELAAEWSPENVAKPDEVLPGSPQKARWICRKHPDHVWDANINSRTRIRAGCPYCANQKVKAGFNDVATTEPWLVAEWSDENSVKPTQITRGSTKKIKWICPTNPMHKYEMTVNDRTSGHGKNCPYCAGRKILAGDNDLQTLYPDVTKEWDHEKNKSLKPTMISAHNMRKVWWKCSNGHSYDMEVANRVKVGINCPICSNKRLLKGYNDLKTMYPDIAEEWSAKNEVPADAIIAGSARRGVWICKNNPKHRWEASVSSRTFSKTGCPFCNTSHGEILVADILSKMNIDFDIQYRFDDCRAEKPLPFDIAVIRAEKPFLVEYDGEQHFNAKGFFGGPERFEVVQSHDNIKSKYCRENGIPLLRIPYIYDPQRDRGKIEAMVRDFVRDGKIPDEVVGFYRQQPGNIYVTCAVA